jgi:hypothetical protein
LTTEACIPSKAKRKSPRRAIVLRAKIKELCLAGNSPIKISKILDKSKQAIYPHIKNLIKDGELSNNETTYVKAGPTEERKWYKILLEVKNALPFWEGRRKPVLRTMHYHLETIAKETHRIEYVRDDHHYNRLARLTGIARKRSINPDYIPPFSDRPYAKMALPILPIDCFVDEKRTSDRNETDMAEPTAPYPPDDPDEYLDNKIIEYREAEESFSNAADEWDPEGIKGNPGGRWWGQPYYPEVWVEKGTARPYIEDAIEDKKSKVL